VVIIPTPYWFLCQAFFFLKQRGAKIEVQRGGDNPHIGFFCQAFFFSKATWGEDIKFKEVVIIPILVFFARLSFFLKQRGAKILSSKRW